MHKDEHSDEMRIDANDEIENPDSTQATPDAPKNANEEIPRDERTIYTGIRIAGQWIDFEERLFLGGTVAMMVPSEFKEMEREIAKIKYPMERRPETILTDYPGTINILFSNLGEPMNNEDAATIRDGMLKIMRRMNPGIKPQSTGEEVIADKSIAYAEFTNPAIDGKLHNLMFFLEVAGKATMISFNCLTKSLKYWRKPAFEMMQSVKVITTPDEL